MSLSYHTSLSLTTFFCHALCGACVCVRACARVFMCVCVYACAHSLFVVVSFSERIIGHPVVCVSVCECVCEYVRECVCKCVCTSVSMHECVV